MAGNRRFHSAVPVILVMVPLVPGKLLNKERRMLNYRNSLRKFIIIVLIIIGAVLITQGFNMFLYFTMKPELQDEYHEFDFHKLMEELQYIFLDLFPLQLSILLFYDYPLIL